MNIQEAVKIALKERGAIRRVGLVQKGIFSDTLIIPTNSYDCCIVLINNARERRQSRCWNPSADDLAADDWEVIF